MIKWPLVSIRKRSKKKYWKQTSWCWQIFIPTAVFRANGFHHCLQELEETYSDVLKVVKINVNFDQALAEQYAVQAGPPLIFFPNGEEKSRLRGAVKKAEITEVIDSLKTK